MYTSTYEVFFRCEDVAPEDLMGWNIVFCPEIFAAVWTTTPYYIAQVMSYVHMNMSFVSWFDAAWLLELLHIACCMM